MKHALNLESKARRKAEDLYAEEVQRRVEAERAATALAEQNMVLDAETRVWARAAAETFAMTIASQMSQPQTEFDWGGTSQESMTSTAVDPDLSPDSTSQPSIPALADPKGKGRVLPHQLQSPAGAGEASVGSSNVLERAAGQY